MILKTLTYSMKYVIISPPYTKKSAGIFALYELQRHLILAGERAIVFNVGGPITLPGDNDIVIYPEVIPGNPLNAKNVVRYILNEPGKLGGDTEYDEKELLVAWDISLVKYSGGMKLRIPLTEKELFYDHGKERLFDCMYIGKGEYTHVPEIDGCTEITKAWPKTREGLARLLNMTNTLYTYDDRTALSEEALMCGCNVVEVIDGKLRKKEPIHEYESEFKKDLESFIEKTKAMVLPQLETLFL